MDRPGTNSYTPLSEHELREELNRLNVHKTWRVIAMMPKFQGVHWSTLANFAAGRRRMPAEHCERFGLPIHTEVQPINGDVAPGSQTLGSRECACGRAFISNAGANRKHCFTCRPYRKRKG